MLWPRCSADQRSIRSRLLLTICGFFLMHVRDKPRTDTARIPKNSWYIQQTKATESMIGSHGTAVQSAGRKGDGAAIGTHILALESTHETLHQIDGIVHHALRRRFCPCPEPPTSRRGVQTRFNFPQLLQGRLRRHPLRRIAMLHAVNEWAEEA